MKWRAYRDDESSMKLSEWSQCHKVHEHRMNPRLEGRYSSYFQEKRIELTEKQAFNYHLCRIDNMISKLIPICIIFFVLCPIAVSQGITSDQWIKNG
jgi:hypothetical protein